MQENMRFKKKRFLSSLLNLISKQRGVISVTHVGSFFTNKLEEISDIDIVVIVDELTPDKYIEIKEKVSNFSISKYFADYEILLNTTFGPLKISKENTLVIHLMIYSLEDHIKHTIESPFTTFDWERSNDFKKKSLSSLKKTFNLSLQDFLNSYRGSHGYLEDLESKQISSKRYVIDENKIKLTNFTEEIDKKYEIEFSYHVIRNTIGNYLKLILNKNTAENFKQYWNDYLSDLYVKYYPSFIKLRDFKLSKNYEEGFDLNITKNFINEFNDHLKKFESNSKEIIFLRHMETKLNAEGIFYGTQTDSEIISDKVEIDQGIVDNNFTIYSSESKRAILSAEKYNFTNIQIVNEINEIEYGNAENMKFREYEKKYYINSILWKFGIDKRFPNGENHSDVLKRVKLLIRRISKSSILFTHLVPIRSFIGDYYDIPKKDWYKIYIPHNKPVKFLIQENKIISNIDRLLLSEIFKNL
jgi:broad specificity phosphatase PhoE/predicted nucleotidyltransferase